MNPVSATSPIRGLIWMAAGLAFCATVHAADMVLPIETDAYLDSAAANAAVNYGAAGTVKVLISGTDGSACRGLFQLPPEVGRYDSAKLAKVEVGFYVFKDQTSGRNVTLYPLTRPFVEGTGNADGATWTTCDGTNAWTAAGGDFDVDFPVIGTRDPNGFFRWDVTALLANPAARSNLLAHGALAPEAAG